MKTWLTYDDLSNALTKEKKDQIIQAQKEGVEARLAGRVAYPNPYGDTNAGDAWTGGWMDAYSLVNQKIAQVDDISERTYTPEEADFIPDFIGRQCGNCAYYQIDKLNCRIAPVLNPVYPNAYCDGYYPTEVMIENRGPVTLSRFSGERMLFAAPYEGAILDVKDAIKFYDNIKGVNCGSCYWQDNVDDSVCYLVDTKISSYCCCSFWNVGKEEGFVGLIESRSGIQHGGEQRVTDSYAEEYAQENIELGPPESAPTTNDTTADLRFIAKVAYVTVPIVEFGLNKNNDYFSEENLNRSFRGLVKPGVHVEVDIHSYQHDIPRQAGPIIGEVNLESWEKNRNNPDYCPACGEMKITCKATQLCHAAARRSK